MRKHGFAAGARAARLAGIVAELRTARRTVSAFAELPGRNQCFPISEVWFWRRGELEFFLLGADGADYKRSPTSRLLPGLPIIDDKLYFFEAFKKQRVIAATDVFGVLGKSELRDGCMATPAVAGKSLIIRTKTALYRVEQ